MKECQPYFSTVDGRMQLVRIGLHARNPKFVLMSFDKQDAQELKIVAEMMDMIGIGEALDETPR